MKKVPLNITLLKQSACELRSQWSSCVLIWCFLSFFQKSTALNQVIIHGFFGAPSVVTCHPRVTTTDSALCGLSLRPSRRGAESTKIGPPHK